MWFEWTVVGFVGTESCRRRTRGDVKIFELQFGRFVGDPLIVYYQVISNRQLIVRVTVQKGTVDFAFFHVELFTDFVDCVTIDHRRVLFYWGWEQVRGKIFLEPVVLPENAIIAVGQFLLSILKATTYLISSMLALFMGSTCNM